MRRSAATLALAAAGAALLLLLVAAPRGAAAINLQTANQCNCLTPACVLDIPGAGGTLACFVNITTCGYFVNAKPKSDVFDPMTIHVDATGEESKPRAAAALFSFSFFGGGGGGGGGGGAADSPRQ